MQLLFLDFETTGLDPAGHLPLELGAICWDSEKGIQGQVEYLIQQDVSEAKRLADAYVLDLHTRTGLWGRLTTGATLPVEEVDQQLRSFVDTMWGPDGSVLIAGYSVKFDLAWSHAKLPAFSKRLDYHVVDVSSFRKVWRMGGLPEYPVPPKKAHRALADCHEALDEHRWYLECLRGMAHFVSGLDKLRSTGVLHP